MKPLSIVTLPIAPGDDHVIFRLVPPGVVPAEDRGYVDPLTATSFQIVRIDELTPGETFAECGRNSKSVRIVVRNVSDAPAAFRMEIPVIPSPTQLTAELSKLAEDAWRRAWDRMRRSN